MQVEIQVVKSFSFYEGTLEEFEIDAEIQAVRISRMTKQIELLGKELRATEGLRLREERKCQVFEIASLTLALFLICALARLWA